MRQPHRLGRKKISEILLDNLVNHIYRCHMETKEDLIKDSIRSFLRIAKMYSLIEEMPIPVQEGLVVTTREAHTIQAIGEEGAMSVTQVADYFGVTKSAASQMVSRLVKRKFLLKKQSLHSNKEYELTLTPLGWTVYREHERLHGGDMAEIVERLSAFSLSQVATLSVLLEALDEVMSQRLASRAQE